MNRGISVNGVSKRFILAAKNTGPVSVWTALRLGEQTIDQRVVNALSNVSFAVPSGQRLGIIGSNGAGKTTLLSMLVGVTEPTSGTIEIDGTVHAILTIGAVLRDEASGRENIRLDGAIHGRTEAEIEAYADEVIAFSELGDFIDRPVRTYSSGMKARLAFSMAAFIRPDVLIIDETLSVGDAFFSRKATQRMKEVAARGRIVILVSHGLGSIIEMCDRCIWMDKGRIVMDGDPRTVTKAYEDAIDKANEAQLEAKFARSRVGDRPSDHQGSLSTISALQNGVPLAGRGKAFVPISLVVEGTTGDMGDPRLSLAIERVDGRKIYRRDSQEAGLTLPADSPFQLAIEFDPLVFGADLYRFDVVLRDGESFVDADHLVCEIVDEEGQVGGVPLLLDPPRIEVRHLDETGFRVDETRKEH